ncbi:Tm-1-like ATP-binding domain-containing protein [Dictyobacter vulcani]|nr:Tm-1-like ATP-binding domain-containing protein [Dictyobacter vulcani]
MATVILLGTLDTKGMEYDYLRQCIQQAGCDVILIDVGIKGQPQIKPDIPHEQVAQAANVDLAQLVATGDRNTAIEAMARGATRVVLDLFQHGRVQGIFGLGGFGSSTLVTQVMRALPIGLPKLVVATMVAGDTRPFVGAVDITMMHSVVDMAGINRISEHILTNAAAGIAGMATAYATFKARSSGKPLIGITMFSVTAPCVNEARTYLEEHGYEVLVFHANGTGGQSMETLVKDGFLAGILDITPTELADELLGGIMSAGPQRLEAAGAKGIPQIVSLGALDMVNFGPMNTVPDKFRRRKLYNHNEALTLMRTTEEENAELGRLMARKLNQAQGPIVVFIPLHGFSLLDVEGAPFYDPTADQALISNLKDHLNKDIEFHELEMDLNDPRFARAMASRLDEYVQTQIKQPASNQHTTA